MRLALFVSLMVLGVSISSAKATVNPATWSSFNLTSAVGANGDVIINVSSSSSAPLLGIFNNHFGKGVPCGSWDGDMPLTHADFGIVASDVNAGDFQEFVFSSAVTEGLFYIENFDANSMANITVTGATSVSLVDRSNSISYATFGADSGKLTTSNLSYNGEGDAVLRFTGNVTSIRLDYTSGDGQNGVYYTFADLKAVPEPTSVLIMGGLLALGGTFCFFRQRP